MADLFTKITSESAGASPYEFTAVTVEAGTTFAPSTDDKYAGSYSYKAAFDGSDNSAYGSKSFTENKSCYFKFYFKFNTGFAIPGDIAIFLGRDSTTNIIYFYINSSLSLYRLQHRIDSGAAYTDPASPPTITLNEWHCIELYYKSASAAGANDGEAWIKYDGTTIASATELDNDTIACDNFRVGNTLTTVPGAGSIMFFDDIEGLDAVPGGGAVAGAVLYYHHRHHNE